MKREAFLHCSTSIQSNEEKKEEQEERQCENGRMNWKGEKGY